METGSSNYIGESALPYREARTGPEGVVWKVVIGGIVPVVGGDRKSVSWHAGNDEHLLTQMILLRVITIQLT